MAYSRDVFLFGFPANKVDVYFRYEEREREIESIREEKKMKEREEQLTDRNGERLFREDPFVSTFLIYTYMYL